MEQAANLWNTISESWESWAYGVSALYFLLAVFVSAHVLLHKQDDRAALGWFALVWLTPLLGAALYGALGINRIRRKARRLRGSGNEIPPSLRPSPRAEDPRVDEALAPSGLLPLARTVRGVVREPLLPDNEFEILQGGDQAYPRMLEAIESAERSIGLMTYIFDNDAWGKKFAEALGRAKGRGVKVKVLIDGAGVRYSAPTILSPLRHHGVRSAVFLPLGRFWRLPFFNLRNHRKLLVVDGKVAFTGGMNIRASCVLSEAGPKGTIDVHFRVEGPVVSQLLQVFADDWRFATGHEIVGEDWFAERPSMSEMRPFGWGRAIPDGPDEDHDNARWTFLGALACAQHRVQVMTPYFVPDEGLISALSVAALRGVRVDVVLPENNNLPYVAWAAWPKIRRVVQAGCRVYFRPGLFSHEKLFVVDGSWVLFGSANWDARSLRLNFELNTEAYDPGFAVVCARHIDAARDEAREISLGEIERRPRFLRLRDGLARLMSPYL